MLDWLKFTFGSFFSNKFSKEGAHRSFWNVIFALFFTLLIQTAFLSTGFNYSFATHYNKASDFKEFVHNAFNLENIDERLNVQVVSVESSNGNKKEIVSFFGNNTNNKALINTYDNEEQKNLYSYNGYNLIVDTRDSASTYYKFEINIYEFENVENKITFEEYKNLSAEDKAKYSCDLNNPVILNETVILDDSIIADYRNYIEQTYVPTLSEKDSMYALWEQIKNVEKTDANYDNYIYEYYVQAYYGLSVVPTNQYYYQYVYAAYDEKGMFKYSDFLILTDSWCMASFKTDKDVRVTYDGYYDSLEDGYVIFTSVTADDKNSVNSNVDMMILSSYSSVNSIRTVLIGMQVIRYYPTIIITMAVLALLVFCVCKVRRRIYGEKFAEAFKIVSSYLLAAAAISGIVTLVLSFIYSNQVALSVGLWSLLAILTIRTIILIIGEEIANKKNPLYESSKVASTIDLHEEGNEKETRIDLSKIETGTKIIKNEKVDDDDDDFEQMELM